MNILNLCILIVDISVVKFEGISDFQINKNSVSQITIISKQTVLGYIHNNGVSVILIYLTWCLIKYSYPNVSPSILKIQLN